MVTYVYGFAEGVGAGRELLGGKGIGLAQMTGLGIPVPAGFTVTTEACVAYMAAGKEFPPGLADEIDAHLAQLEEQTGKRFGDPDDPLLVSVRSGAAVSMPGMMDTILNLGLNDVAVEGLASATDNPRFAYDAYRRLVQMYGDVVAGVDSYRFEDELEQLKGRRGAAQDVDLTADHLRELVERFKAIYHEGTGEDFPQDARDQLERAVRAVFDSWETPRAQVYRRAHAIPDDLGTAVNVVQMVFGNKGETSGTGVCFTRDPSTGEPGIWGEFLANAQGEDVVAGIRTPEPIAEMESAMPEAFGQLRDTLRRLEEHYREMQDVEFTVEEGQLYILQTRTGKRTAHAALRIAVEMVDEGVISREEAIARIEAEQLDQLLHPMIDPKSTYEPAAEGPERLARRGEGRDRARRRHGRGARTGRRGRDPRPPGDDAGRHPRADPVTRRSHGSRGDDVACGRRRARDGQAVRGRLRGALDRPRRTDDHARRPHSEGGRHDHDRRRLRPCDPRGRRARAAADQRALRDDPRLGRRGAAPEGARERRHARGRGQGARVRRAGDRPLPDGAHVHGRGPAPGRPRDDPGFERRGTARGTRKAPAAPAGRLRGDLRGDGRAAGHDPAARPAAARVPAAARRGRVAADGRPHPRAHRGEPDARHARLPPWAHVPGDLRDAGARDRARGGRGRGAVGRRAARRDHAPARRLCRGAPPPPRAHARHRLGGTGAGRPRDRLPRRHDDRAAARVHPRRRDRGARRLLLLRDERPDADRARLLPRRRGAGLPDALPRGRRARGEPVPAPGRGRRRRPDADRGRARPQR